MPFHPYIKTARELGHRFAMSASDAARKRVLRHARQIIHSFQGSNPLFDSQLFCTVVSHSAYPDKPARQQQILAELLHGSARAASDSEG
jgi:hypothetical protein